jgi:hypothetical protein
VYVLGSFRGVRGYDRQLRCVDADGWRIEGPVGFSYADLAVEVVRQVSTANRAVAEIVAMLENADWACMGSDLDMRRDEDGYWKEVLVLLSF